MAQLQIISLEQYLFQSLVLFKELSVFESPTQQATAEAATRIPPALCIRRNEYYMNNHSESTLGLP